MLYSGSAKKLCRTFAHAKKSPPGEAGRAIPLVGRIPAKTLSSSWPTARPRLAQSFFAPKLGSEKEGRDVIFARRLALLDPAHAELDVVAVDPGDGLSVIALARVQQDGDRGGESQGPRTPRPRMSR